MTIHFITGTATWEIIIVIMDANKTLMNYLPFSEQIPELHIVFDLMTRPHVTSGRCFDVCSWKRVSC
jgi:hypothetical protein